jgi:hypothetical protein
MFPPGLIPMAVFQLGAFLGGMFCGYMMRASMASDDREHRKRERKETVNDSTPLP